MTFIRTVRSNRKSAVCDLRFVICVLIVAGFFGPWVPHKTAGLTVTGYELSKFAKFFPQVQGGAVLLVRSLFIMPLITAVVSFSLLAHRSGTHPTFRIVATLLAVLLDLFVLPPYQRILDPSHRGQLILAGSGAVLVLLTPLARQLTSRVRGALIALLAVAGVGPAVWQYVLLRPLVVDLYDTSVGLGWGEVACVVGFVLLFLSGIRAATADAWSSLEFAP